MKENYFFYVFLTFGLQSLINFLRLPRKVWKDVSVSVHMLPTYGKMMDDLDIVIAVAVLQPEMTKLSVYHTSEATWWVCQPGGYVEEKAHRFKI